MTQKAALGGLVVVVIALATALGIGWATTRADVDRLSHRLATTQAVLSETQMTLASAQAQALGGVQATVATQSQRLEQLRASVNHLCNVAARNPVEVSPLSGQYTIC